MRYERRRELAAIREREDAERERAKRERAARSLWLKIEEAKTVDDLREVLHEMYDRLKMED